MTNECIDCGEDVPIQRWQLGRHTCLSCGDKRAKQERSTWTVAPLPKSNYMLITDPAMLVGLNNSHKGART